jgi:hypothetical protein
VNRGEVYCELSRLYGWTPQQIADLSLEQQEMYLNGGQVDPRTGRAVVSFGSIEEARRYQDSLRRSGGR